MVKYTKFQVICGIKISCNKGTENLHKIKVKAWMFSPSQILHVQ
jgi:hypothetical protein